MKHIIPLLFVLLFVTIAAAQEPKHLTFQSVPFTDVKFDDDFWSPRLKINREISIPHNYEWCEKTGRLMNFAKAAKLLQGDFEGIYFNDSDVYKLLEGTAYSLADHPDAELEKRADAVIDWIAAAQLPNGYINSYFQLKEPDKKWTNIVRHELYCCGHMIEAAVAYKRATGKDKLLGVAEKFVDHIIDVFGPDKKTKFEVPGHEEIELALVKLYELTGKEKYFKLAEQFVDVRGDQSKRGDKIHGAYDQDHEPIRQASEIVGHAVRAVYLYAGVADVAAYTGDEGYIKAMDRLWNDVVNKKMYVTGGIGARHAGEAFGDAFELPNRTAYCETCAAIGLVFWAHRMNLLHGDAKYADIVERCMFNGVLSGIGMDGKHFFYVNPLESVGNHHRQPFFDCACCPTNVVRFVPSLPGYQYALQDNKVSTIIRGNPNRGLWGRITGLDKKVEPADGSKGIIEVDNNMVIERVDVGCNEIVVNQFVSGKTTVDLKAGQVKIEQKTDYPWSGKVEMTFTPKNMPNTIQKAFNIKVRIPEWCSAGAKIAPFTVGKNTLREMKADTPKENGYFSFQNPLSEKVSMTFHFPMEPKRIIANPKVLADRGRVAVMRGPIVYCFEQVDNEVPVLRIKLAKDPEFKEEFRKDLLGGVVVLKCKNADGRELTAIPYYAWDHREPGPMAVWVRQQGLTKEPKVDDPSWGNDKTKEPILYRELKTEMLTAPDETEPEPEFFVVASHCHGGDSVDAVVEDGDPKSSNDQGISRHTFWGHKGTAEWIEIDFGKSRKVSQSSVYWFDDTGKGGCRVPKSWTLSYKDGKEWKPVKTTGTFGVEKDKYNTVEFDAVETTGLRINVQLQKDMSGGVLRWKFQ